MMMDKQLFYLVWSDLSHRYLYATRNDSLIGFSSRQCETCGRNIIESSYSNKTHVLKLDGGKKAPDRLQYCDAGDRLHIFSKYALDIFTQYNITGIAAKEAVECYDTRKKQSINIPEYYNIIISGKVNLAFGKMCLKKKKRCASCGQFEWNKKQIFPIVLDIATWSGCDLSSIEDIPGFIVCTEKFKKMVDKEKLSGFRFEAVSISE